MRRARTQTQGGVMRYRCHDRDREQLPARAHRTVGRWRTTQFRIAIARFPTGRTLHARTEPLETNGDRGGRPTATA